MAGWTRPLARGVPGAWRKRVGLTQDQLAGLFHLGRRTIGYYEDGTLLVPRVVAPAMKAESP